MAQEVNEEKIDDSEFEPVYDSTTKEKFELFVSNKDFTVDNNNGTITYSSGGNWQTLYGTQVFDPSTHPQKIRWHIKYLSGSSMIGISAVTNDLCTNTYCFTKNSFKNYGYYLNNGHKYWGATSAAFGETFAAGDIMIVELDLIGKKISYWRNNKFLGIAYDNIETNNIKYNLVICACSGKYVLEKCLVYGDIPSINWRISQILSSLDGCINTLTKVDSKLTNKDDPKYGKLKNLIKIQQKLESSIKDCNIASEKCGILCKLADKVNAEMKERMHFSTEKYEEWDINDILLWIVSLEKGRFKGYYDKLNKSFSEHSMKGSDLPDLTRRDLRDFGVKAFGDSVALEKYCQRLLNDYEGSYNQLTKQ